MTLYNYSKAEQLLREMLDHSDEEKALQIIPLLAKCYRMTGKWEDAALLYEELIAWGKATDEDYFWFGTTLRYNGNYDLARKAFLKAAEKCVHDSLSLRMAAFCDSALRWRESKPIHRITNLKVLNTPQSEFGITLIPDGMLFVSDRTSGNQKRTYGWTGNSYLQIYQAETMIPEKYDSLFSDPVVAPKPLNQAWHDGPVSYDSTFTLLLINRTRIGRPVKREGQFNPVTYQLMLFSSSRVDGVWDRPRPFFLNNPDYSVGHPALSADGSLLLFVSDMPGGYGGTDIYACQKKNDTWGDPVNLGSEINTPGNEMFPYLSPRGDLCFASDGHPGFGGLDLFFCAKDPTSRWSIPVHLNHPVNSSRDDFSLITTDSCQSGYFSSNRPGGKGEDDLYYFCRIPEAPLIVELPPHDSIQDLMPEPYQTSSGDTITIRPEIDPPGMPFELNKPYRLETIYYDFDQWSIRPDAQPSLDSLITIMKLFPVHVELSAHTDCRGTAEYNLILSQKRAESAVNYLIGHGIDPKRLTAKGYGEQQLINDCDCSASSPCTEKEHQENRRTEFTIIKVGQ